MKFSTTHLVAALVLLMQAVIGLGGGRSVCVETGEDRGHALCAAHEECDSDHHHLAPCHSHAHSECECHVHIPLPDDRPAPTRAQIRADSILVRTVIAALTHAPWTPAPARPIAFTPKPEHLGAGDRALSLRATRLLL